MTAQDMNAFAAQVADSHLRAAVAAAQGPFGSFEKLRAAMLDNFALLRTHLGERAGTEAARAACTLDRGLPYAARAADPSRRQSGMVRECHGDLHARNIVRWRQQWMPFDCLEFDPELRWIDVISDVAFLFMDLVSRHRDRPRPRVPEPLPGGDRRLRGTASVAAVCRLPGAGARQGRCAGCGNGRSGRASGTRGAPGGTPRDRRALHGCGAAGARHHARRHGIRKILAERANGVRRFLPCESVPISSANAWRASRRSRGASSASVKATTRPTSMQRTYEWLLECAESAMEGGCNVDHRCHVPGSRAPRYRSAPWRLRRQCRFLIVSWSPTPRHSRRASTRVPTVAWIPRKRPGRSSKAAPLLAAAGCRRTPGRSPGRHQPAGIRQRRARRNQVTTGSVRLPEVLTRFILGSWRRSP